MSDPTRSALSTDELLSELSWVRRLARSLVGSGAADDVAQEAMLVALSRSQALDGERRAWLFRVTRNIAAKWRRSGARRFERESDAARGLEQVERNDPLVRAELHEQLVHEVQRLDEPYRAVVLLRYLEARSPQEIGRQLSVPASTVRTRLSRGLEQLRRRLDAEHGRERWLAALAPLVGAASSAKTPAMILMSKKPVLFAAGALVLVVGGQRLLDSPDPLPPEEVQASPLEPERLSLETSQDESAPEATRSPVPEPVETVAVAVDQDWPLEVEVHLRLVLDDGTVLDDLDGEAKFALWHDLSSTSVEGSRAGTGVSASVQGGIGVFTADPAEILQVTSTGTEPRGVPLPSRANVQLEVKEIVLGGRAAVPVLDRGQHYPVGPGPTVIELQWTRELVLHVRDAADGRHLEDVRARYHTPRNMFGMDLSETEPAKPAFEGESSPIVYRPPTSLASEKRVIFQVMAPGYQWTRALLNPARGGVQEVLLEPGGRAEVTIEGEVDDRTYLQVWSGSQPQGRRPTQELRVVDSIAAEGERLARLSVEGLALGRQTLVLSEGRAKNDGPELGRVDFTVHAEETTEVFLRLDASLRPRPAELSGWLELDPFWLERVTVLALESASGDPFQRWRMELPIADMERVKGRDDLYAWDAGEVLTGDYTVSIHGLPMGVRIEVGPEGLHDARVAVPDPGQVSIEVVDERDGRPVKDCTMNWSVVSEGKLVTGLTSESSQRDPETGRFEITAPQGKIQATFVANHYRWDSEVLEVGPGRREHTLRATPTSTLMIKLVDGTETVPLPEPVTELEFVPVDSEEPVKLDGFGRSGEFDTARLAPGAYWLELPEVPGYEPVAAQRLDLLPGEPFELVIELVRR